ncbi:MAG: hypothetical protein LBR37_02615 [Erysipelotrichaceae bacterium]|jgi:hypothetical protein|nr:hypothetical protein [Erysipelotrichaceae bacterium]
MANQNLHEPALKRFIGLATRKLIKCFSKTLYVKLQYRYITHHKLNLKNPTRYTEKLQYLRLYLYPKDPRVSKCASRDGLRQYAKELGLSEYLIPSYGIFNHFEDLDLNMIPLPFVLKCTHASSYNYFCFEKDDIKYDIMKRQFIKWLKTNYGKKTVEMHYSKIPPRIIAEKILLENEQLPIEYKIHVFNGKAKYLYVVTGRGQNIRYTNLLTNWQRFDGAQFNGWKSADITPLKPHNFDEMIAIAEKLAAPFPFVRVDFFNINGRIFLNEMTFTPAKGTLIFDDDKCDFEIGKWLDINTKS